MHPQVLSTVQHKESVANGGNPHSCGHIEALLPTHEGRACGLGEQVPFEPQYA
jgi:hypothetical protein